LEGAAVETKKQKRTIIADGNLMQNKENSRKCVFSSFKAIRTKKFQHHRRGRGLKEVNWIGEQPLGKNLIRSKRGDREEWSKETFGRDTHARVTTMAGKMVFRTR